MSTTPARRISLSSLALTPLLAGALLVGTGGAPPASTTAPPSAAGAATTPATGAAPGTGATGRSATAVRTVSVAYLTPTAVSIARGQSAVRIAAAQRGKPYRWGGAGPRSFDCSGLVYYVYKKRLHVQLPRTANAQRLKTIRIAKSSVRPGDLIFFMSHGRAYHVGIYAGHGKIWHSPRPGQRVKLQKIWTSQWRAGRIR
ncbi:C40 family peptidase [Intrasporangium sp. YIM S08009]|uniref:C40 family peptidase n=1 Tax=Intrasporangium zincisolvens TaxID=3080018 RepID=UPI002B05AEAF|nr:C40 family peptidase [Intrasporangium sp. YIM S08009]